MRDSLHIGLLTSDFFVLRDEEAYGYEKFTFVR